MLSKLLHRNPGARSIDTEYISTTFYELARFWTLEENALLQDINEKIDRAELHGSEVEKDSEHFKLAWLARAGLDIWLQRTDQLGNVAEELVERVEKIILAKDEVEFGIKTFSMGDFELAVRSFEKAVEFSDEIDRARRWLYLSKSIEDITPEHKDRAKELAFTIEELMSLEDFTHAKERLAELKQICSHSEQVDYLVAESNFFEEFKIVERNTKDDNFEEASKYLRACAEWLEKIPTKKYILEEVGSIQDRIDEIEFLRDTRGKAIAAYSEYISLIKQEDWEKAADVVEQIYQYDPEYDDHLGEYADGAARAISAGAFAPAYRMCEAGLRISKYKDLVILKGLASLLQKGMGISDVSNHKRMVSFIQEFRNELSHPLALQYVKIWIQLAQDLALNKEDMISLEDIAQLCKDLNLGEDFNQARFQTQIERAMNDAKREKDKNASALIEEAADYIGFDTDPMSLMAVLRGADLTYKISKITDAKERFALAKRKLALAQALSDSPVNIRKINDLRKFLTVEIQESKRAIDKLNDLATDRKSKQKKALTSAHKSLKEKLEKNKDANTDSCIEEISTLIKDCYDYLQSIDPQDEKVKEFLMDAAGWMDDKSPTWWKKHAEDMDSESRLIMETLGEARSEFENGNAVDAMAKLNRITNAAMHTPAWNKEKTRALVGYEFKQFLLENAKIIAEKKAHHLIFANLRSYAKLGLPIIYWGRSNIHFYLRKAERKACKRVVDHAGSVSDEKYLDKLKLWIDAKHTIMAVDASLSTKGGKKHHG